MARSPFRFLLPLAVLTLAIGAPALAASAATSGTWTVTGSMNTARFQDDSAVLPDGEVLVLGGSTSPTRAELYNPATGTWAFTGSLTTDGVGFTLTVLPDGQVLAAGGGSATAELYNPATGTWSATGSMTASRENQTATLLPDGQVLVTGGYNSSITAQSSAELYNPATGTWSATGSMSTARADQTATLLPDGKVLVTGGYDSNFNVLSSAELYNPATGTWSATGSMASPREGQQATLLPDGNVLVSAGIEAAAGSFAELYNPAAGTWSAATGGLNLCLANFDCRIGSSATLLGNGQVLVAGGLYGLDTNPSSTASAILYNPATNSWTLTGSLTTAREDQTAGLLTSGQVLVAGGANFVSHKFTALSSAELYTP